VGSDTPIFFPVLNTIVDNSEPPPTPNDNFTEAQLRSFAAFLVGADTTPPGNVMHASVDGTDIPNLVSYRELSPKFTYTVPLTDNLWQNIGANITQPAPPAVSDGYWVMLKPLSPGQHTLHFTGSVGNTGFSVDETYQITVVPQGQYNQQVQPFVFAVGPRISTDAVGFHKNADEEVLSG